MAFDRRLLVVTLLTLTLPVSASSVRGRGAHAGVAAPTEASLFYQPTPPVPLTRVLTESAPVTTLVVALPEQQVLLNEVKAQFFVRLIGIAVRYVKVVVLVNHDERSAIVTIKDLIRKGVESPDAVLERLTFLRAAVDTEWVRDYGPAFGMSERGEPVLLDNMYRDIRSEAETARAFGRLGLIKTPEDRGIDERGRQVYLSDYGHFWRMYDDAAPLYFNDILYMDRFAFAPLVRTPLELAGGDLAFTDDGRMLTSTRTLEANGGDEWRFRRLAQEYFNVKDVLYLRPLPNSLWHIDMFFKLARPGVVLMGQFESQQGGQSAYLADLQREAADVLAWDRRLIEAKFPGVEIVPVPMPPIVQPGSTSPGATVAYPSFINSVVLNGADGRSAVVIPRFSGLERMEATVEAAYRRAFPGADIHFLNADVLVDDFGGIHCVTATIPSFAAQR